MHCVYQTCGDCYGLFRILSPTLLPVDALFIDRLGQEPRGEGGRCGKLHNSTLISAQRPYAVQGGDW